MATKFFISGKPKTGKTHVLNDLAKELKAKGYRVGGFISPAIKEHGTREGFYVENIETGEQTILADMQGGGPRVSKYHVDVKDFEDAVLPILKESQYYDVIIIDEIGKMELESIKFEDKLDDLLQSDTLVVASIQPAYLENYESLGEVYNLTGNNSREVSSILLRRLVAMPKAARKVKPSAKPATVKAGKKPLRAVAAKARPKAVKTKVKSQGKKAAKATPAARKTEKHVKKAPVKEVKKHGKKEEGLLDKIVKLFRF